MKSNDDNDDNDLYNSRMFDEYSLADSQTLGTGYIVKKDANDGSVSMITDDLVEESTRTSNSDNALQTEFSGWNVFGNLFSRVSTVQINSMSLGQQIILLLVFILL